MTHYTIEITVECFEEERRVEVLLVLHYLGFVLFLRESGRVVVDILDVQRQLHRVSAKEIPKNIYYNDD